MDNITTSSPTATYASTAVDVTSSLSAPPSAPSVAMAPSMAQANDGWMDGSMDVMRSDPLQWMIVFTMVSMCLWYAVFLYRLTCIKPKKMRYYSKLTAEKWYADFYVTEPWKARYKINKPFTFEPLFDPKNDKEVIAINGWTNSTKGNAYFVTQDREIYLSEVQRLKKLNIPWRSTIEAYWDGSSNYPYLTEIDLNVDVALEDAWQDIHKRQGCMCCSPELRALFYVIQVMPSWCDEQTYEEMKAVVGMKEKASV